MVVGGGREAEGSVFGDLIETGERFLHLGEVAGGDVHVADEFVDVLGDDLESHGHVGKAFAVGAFLS